MDNCQLLLPAALFPAASVAELATRIALIGFLGAGLAYALGRGAPLLAAFGMVTAAVLADLYLHQGMLQRNLLSDFANIGARFYGISNEWEGLLLGTTVLLPFWMAESAQSVNETPREDADDRKQRKREEAQRRNRLSPLKAELEKIERRLASVTKDLQALEATLAGPELYAPDAKAQLKETLQRQTELKRELDSLESAWLECHERLETAAASS